MSGQVLKLNTKEYRLKHVPVSVEFRPEFDIGCLADDEERLLILSIDGRELVCSAEELLRLARAMWELVRPKL